METLNISQYQPYLAILTGVTAMLITLFYKSKAKKLAKNGKRCEGIIFKLGLQGTWEIK